MPLSRKASERIRAAYFKAERELQSALAETIVAEGEKHEGSITPFLPAIRAFACALLDASAVEMDRIYTNPGNFRKVLDQEVAPRIIEEILPDRTLNHFCAEPETRERQLRWVYHVHGAWESAAPGGIRFLLRWTGNNELVRKVLSQELAMRAFYWVESCKNNASLRRTLKSVASKTSASASVN